VSLALVVSLVLSACGSEESNRTTALFDLSACGLLHVFGERAEPSLQGKIIGALVAGQRVTVWQVDGVWWRIETAAGLFGWAHSGSLRPVKELVRGAQGLADAAALTAG
jgi:hypothetical protein